MLTVNGFERQNYVVDVKVKVFVTPSFPQRAKHINTFTGMRKGLRSLLLSVLCFSQDSSDAAASFAAATQQVHWLCQHLIPPL